MNLMPSDLGPALSTIGKAIASARAYKDGCLEVHFADASTLSVKPGAEYEAWEIAGTGGLRVVCTPGGSLSIWQPEGLQEDRNSLTQHGLVHDP